jgi:hypothetical protein
LGVNASSDDVTINPEGGLKFETDGADGDENIVLPHLNTGQSAWTNYTWGTDQLTCWEGHFKSGTSIANTIMWAGLKLTNTEVLVTDNDQVYLRYEDDVNSGKFVVVYSIAGTDVSVDTGVACAVSTEYHVRITIDSSRIARVYLNGALVATSTALGNAVDLKPYMGIAADGAAARSTGIFTARRFREPLPNPAGGRCIAPAPWEHAMPRVRIDQYSNFHDPTTGAQFEPVLDRRSGCYVGVCEMSKSQARAYQGRASFTVLSDDEWLAMTEIPREPEPTEPETGDPLADQAADSSAPKPPPAPRSR